MILTLLQRDFRLAVNQLHHILFMGAFLLFCGLLLPFALGPNGETLARYGPGVIWILVLFTLSLSLESFYLNDDQDGSLEQLILRALNPWVVFCAKAITHSLFLIGLILPLTSLLCVIFHVPLSLGLWLDGAFFVAIPGFVFLGGVVTTLSLHARLPILIKPLLLFPLAIPLLIFGIGVTEAVLIHQSPLPFLKILTGISLITMLGSTWVAGKVMETS